MAVLNMNLIRALVLQLSSAVAAETASPKFHISGI